MLTKRNKSKGLRQSAALMRAWRIWKKHAYSAKNRLNKCNKHKWLRQDDLEAITAPRKVLPFCFIPSGWPMKIQICEPFHSFIRQQSLSAEINRFAAKWRNALKISVDHFARRRNNASHRAENS